MSKLEALRALKRQRDEQASEPAPLAATSSVSRPPEALQQRRNLRPSFDTSAIKKAPTGRCECCQRSARLWVQAWPTGREYRYFQSGVEVDGPPLEAYCTKLCAAEVNPAARIAILSPDA